MLTHHHFYNFNTAFPCILMVGMGMFALWSFSPVLMGLYAGSSMGFYGAAWDGERVQVEPFSPALI